MDKIANIKSQLRLQQWAQITLQTASPGSPHGTAGCMLGDIGCKLKHIIPV